MARAWRTPSTDRCDARRRSEPLLVSACRTTYRVLTSSDDIRPAPNWLLVTRSRDVAAVCLAILDRAAPTTSLDVTQK
jgi:multisubunit Na+/H+ antiporter MnhE subunit